MGTTDYGGMFGWTGSGYSFMNGVMIWETPMSVKQIPGGTSHVIIVAEDTGRDWTPLMNGEWANGETSSTKPAASTCVNRTRCGATIQGCASRVL